MTWTLQTVLALAVALWPQSSQLTLRTESRLVQIDVVVKDQNGIPVQDLERKNFTVLDNGKPREFQVFSINRWTEALPIPAVRKPVSQLPPNVFTNANSSAGTVPLRSTVILLDYVNGWFENTAWARQGVLGLMKKVPADEPIALYVIAKDLGLLELQEYTTDRDLLVRRVSQYVPRATSPAPVGTENFMLALNQSVAVGGPSAIPHPPAISHLEIDPQEQTPAERAYVQRRAAEMVRLSLNALASHLGAIPGRKSVFWVTTGFPPQEIHGMPSWDDTVHALSDANVAVSAIDSNGLGGPPRRWGPGQVATEIMVAEATGGKAYYGRNDLDNAMLEGIADSRDSYTLGFYLGDHERDGLFHRLEVRVDRPGLELHFRPGYFAGVNKAVESARKGEDVESALLSPVDLSGLGMTVQVDSRPGAVHLLIRLDTNTLSLRKRAGKWSGSVREMFIEKEAEGRILRKISDTKNFVFPDAKRADYDRDGAPLPTTISLANGADRLTIVIRDVATGHTGSLTIPLVTRPAGQ